MINKIDLAGKWYLFLDKNCNGENISYNDTINLPNTTSNAQKGEYNSKRETGFLTDTYKFEGFVWYKKNIEIAKNDDRIYKLFLERTRITTLYINGEKIGSQESLCTPHVYDISDYLDDGENEIIICVSNVGYKTGGGHLTSEDTQTNWNGITGKIEIQIYNNVYLENVMIFANAADKSFKITADVVGSNHAIVNISAQSKYGKNADRCMLLEVECKNAKLDCIYSIGENALLWSEFEPNLYSLKISVGEDEYVQTVGLRDFSNCGDKFEINGVKTFLRGKHDGLIFPKTGFSPCDLDEWLRILKIAQSYGINHYRFHTCCPPEAAFEAADILGIYMQPELPFWGTLYNVDEEEYNEQEQSFLIEEGFKMLKAFGNHPSFCMMSLGNELWGSKERLDAILRDYKMFDNRHLYTQGSNNFQWTPCVLEHDDFFVGVRLSKDRLIRGSYAMCDAPLGHIQTTKPSTRHDYDEIICPENSLNDNEAFEDEEVQIQFGTQAKTVKTSKSASNVIPEIPIVTHEIGQFQTYPNFDEINKYSSSIKAKNFEIFRERLIEKNLSHLAKDYFECSGKLAVACYKEELESVFRSRKLAGFQILDIQDFSGQGTALVGILDAFMDNKGLISSDQWQSFCSNAVLMARFDSYTIEEGRDFKAHVELAYYRNEDISNHEMCWEITGDNKTLFSGKSLISGNGNYFDIADIKVKMPKVFTPKKLNFKLWIDGTNIKNNYELMIYPYIESLDFSNVNIFEQVDDKAKEVLSQGKTVLIAPNLEKLENAIEGFFCQDFWCYHMFNKISISMNKPTPIGTMGLLIQNSHKALAEFTCEKWSTPQWWDIVMNSKSEILDDDQRNVNIIVQTIDNFERNHRLGLLYEYEDFGGKVLVCNCDFEKLLQSVEGKQFMQSLKSYIQK